MLSHEGEQTANGRERILSIRSLQPPFLLLLAFNEFSPLHLDRFSFNQTLEFDGRVFSHFLSTAPDGLTPHLSYSSLLSFYLFLMVSCVYYSQSGLFKDYSRTNSSFHLCLQVMESHKILKSQRTSFKQVLIQDPSHVFSIWGEAHKDNTKAPNLIDDSDPDPLSMAEDEEVPDLFDSDIKDMYPFYHVYLIGKILEKLFRLSLLRRSAQ